MQCNVLFFHSNRVMMRPGDIVAPGNYGRLIAEAGEGSPHWHREHVLERVRAEHYPQKPSRLRACFTTLGIDTAQFYHVHQCPEGTLYLVTLVDFSQPWHLGDFNVVQPLPGRDETMEETAHAYRTNRIRTNVEGVTCEEVVTGSALRVHGSIAPAGRLPAG